MKQETLSILKSFSSLNKSIRITKGKQIDIYSTSFSVLAHANIDDEFPKTFSIYDLNQWLSTLSLFDEPTVEYKDKSMEIVKGNKKVKYRYSHDSITSDQVLISSIPKVDEIFTFEISKEQLQELLKASSVLSLSLIKFTPNYIHAYSKSSSDGSLDNEYIIELDNANITDEFHESINKMAIKVESAKFIITDYKVTITPKYIRFDSLDNVLTYIVGGVSTK